MRRSLARPFALAGLLVSALAAAPQIAEAQPCANTSAVTSGQWYSFSFGTVGSIGTGNIGSPPIPGALDPSRPCWSYSSASSFRVLVLDAYVSGDQFALRNNEAVVGLTSASESGGNCVTDLAACLADSRFSRGEFLFDAGSYAFDIRTEANAAGTTGGVAAFRIDPTSVPEPGSAALAALGMIGVLSSAARRRRGAHRA